MSDTNTNTRMQVSIVGAGISGLVLGRCLLQHGIKAAIFEKARQSQHRNTYGITLHASSFRPLLSILGLDEPAFRRRVAVDGVGKINNSKTGDFRADRNRFESLLAEGLDVRWETEVQRVESGEVRLASGEQVPSKVVVGADGPHSQVRQSILPDVEFKILPYAVYNGKRRLSTEDFESQLASGFGEGTVVEQRIDGALFQVSISDRSPGEVSISYTYSRPARDGQDALFRPGRSKGDAKVIPDELFQEVDQARSRLNSPLATVFEPQKMREDRLLNWLMRTVNLATEDLKESAESGIVLMGDAIHAEPIVGGHGANQAIEDGVTLAEILAKGRNGGLREFYAARKEAWKEGTEDSEKRIRILHTDTSRHNL